MHRFRKVVNKLHNGSCHLRPLSTTVKEPRVKISQGELLGKTDKTFTGNTFLSFQGIPYAKPPVGELRFKAPQTPDGWTGLRDATKEGNVCPQIDIFSRKLIGNEDCLYLNVYTPKLNPKIPYPVMVFIHGGAYLIGSGNSDLYGANFLLDKDVILVTLNYRLGALGFLQLDIPEAPGNAGLRDQVAALQWVQSNIANFGGDPKNVTVFGSSAGAFSIHYLMLSPMGLGLFNRAILQGGTALSQLAFTRNGPAKAFHLAKLIGKETTTPEHTLSYLQSASVKDIVKYQMRTRSDNDKRRSQPISFVAGVEKQFDGIQICVPADPASIIKSGEYNKIPFMIGYNEKEGLVMLNGILKYINEFENDFERAIPKYLDVELGTEKSRSIAQQIRKLYFKGEPINSEAVSGITDWITDYSFATGINMSIGMHLQTMDLPIYMYRFSFSGLLNLYKIILGVGKHVGACHGDELFYLLKQNFKKIPFEDHESTLTTMKRMVEMWTNFAKFGNPTPVPTSLINLTWTPVSKSQQFYLNIGEELKLGVDPDKERLDFWRDNFTKYNGHFLNPKI